MAVSQFTGILEQKKFLTDDVMMLSFKVPPTITFAAGQYVMIDLARDGMRRLKSYSILNPPSAKGKIDLCAKIIDGGFASECFRLMQEGESFAFRGPLGHFEFDETAEEHWFICSGTGLTPFHSMILEHLPRHSQQKFVLLFGVRSREDLFLHEEMGKLEQSHTNFTYIPTLSQDSWEGARGRVQQHLPQDVSGKVFYICGLGEMVLETKELLLQKGVSPEKIRTERYT